MGYEIVLCKVESVDTVTKKVLLKPHTPTHFNTIEVTAGAGLKFASSYAPYTRVADPDDGKVFNTPVGFVNYPQQDDLVLAAIWITDVSRQDRLRTKLVQNQNMEVIIFAKISWQFPDIGTHDNILGDRSGAKIHFNHGWLDTDHLGKDVQGDKTIHLPTGHVTSVGNRVVRISGKKFLPFGLHSHNLGKEGANRDNSKIINEEGGEPVGWGKAFTKDPTETNLYNDLPSESKRGSKKFLEPPCPEPGSMMDMHDSGYKHLVETSGHVRKYLPTGGVFIIGDNSTDDYKKMSFLPEGEPTEKDPGVVEFFFYNPNDKVLSVLVDALNDKVTIITNDGPAITIDGPSDVVEFEMAGGLTFTIDGANGKITTDAASGFEFTGDLTVTGAIEATTSIKAGTTVEATTKVITPTVSDS